MKTQSGLKSRPHRSRILRPTSAVAAAAVLALACGTVMAASRPFEELIPEGASVYLSVRSCPELLAKVRNTPQYRLWSEPAMQPFKEELAKALEEMRAEMVKALGADPAQLERVLGGQVSLAILPRSDRDAHFLLLADVSGDSQAAEAIVQSLIKYSREQEGRYAIKEEAFRGHTIYCIEPLPQPEPEGEQAPPGKAPWEAPEFDRAAPPEARPAQGEGPDDEWNEEWPVERFRPRRRTENPGFVTLSRGILAVASSPDRSLIEKHLVLSEGGDIPSLAAHETYKRLDPHMGAERDITLLVDFRQLWAEEMAAEPELEAFLQAVPGLGVALTLAGDGVATDGLLLAPAPRSGFLRPFVPPGGSVMPPAFVGEEVGVLGGFRFDAVAMWEEVTAVMQRQSPDGYIEFQQRVRELPFDLENDVLKALGSRWFVYLPAPSGGEEGGPEVAGCGELRDSAAFSRALPEMLGALPEFLQVKTVDFMGLKVYTLASSFGVEMDVEPVVCFAVLPDKALWASDLNLMKTIIKDDQREASPLVANAGFQRLLGRTTDNPDAILLLDGRVIMEWIAGVMEAQRAMVEELRAPAELPNEGAPPEALPEMLPVELLKKYETQQLMTARWADEGLIIKGWAPHPKVEQ